MARWTDKVYTPEELKRDYRLTDQQAGLFSSSARPSKIRWRI